MTPTPPDDDHARLVLSKSSQAVGAAYDDLLTVAPLVLTTAETALLIQARAATAELHRSIEARRTARVVRERAEARAAEREE